MTKIYNNKIQQFIHLPKLTNTVLNSGLYQRSMVTSNTVSIIIYYRCHSVQVLLNWHFIVSKMSTISIFLLYVSCLCYLVGLAVAICSLQRRNHSMETCECKSIWWGSEFLLQIMMQKLIEVATKLRMLKHALATSLMIE